MTLILSGTDGLSDVDGSAATPAIRGTDANTGIFFPAADTIAFSEGGVESARIDASGNMGLGVTPSASTTAGTIYFLNNTTFGRYGYTQNSYFNGTNYIYSSSSQASLYQASSGQHIFYTAASGTAGNTISFTQAMTLDASGSLGIGDTSPSSRLSTGGSTTALLSNQTSTYAPSANAVATSVKLFNNSTTTGAYTSLEFWTKNAGDNINIAYIASPSTSSNDTGTLTFGRRTGGSTSAESMRIDSSGNLLVGTTSVPSLGGNTAGKFAVVNGSAQVGWQDNTDGGIFATYSTSKSIGISAGASYGNGSGYAYIKCTPTTGSSASIVAVANTGGVQLTNGATSWASLSDMRLKDVTSGIDNALSAVAQLEPIKFTWKSDEGKKPCVGLSAQSVQAVLPEAVDEFVVPESVDKTAYLTVRYTELVPLLTAAIQEQQALIQQLQTDVAALKAPQGTP